MDISFSRSPDRKEIWTILINDEVWRRVHQSIFGRRIALPPSHLTDEEWHLAFQNLEYRLAKQYVLRRLSAQSYHSLQLKKLLKEKLVHSQVVDRLIGECLQCGYLDDQNWVAGFIRGHRKRMGLRAILAKLYTKGFSKEDLESIAEEWRDPNEEVEAVCHLIQTRYRSKDLKDYQQKQKVMAALARKGYSFDTIRAAFSMCKGV